MGRSIACIVTRGAAREGLLGTPGEGGAGWRPLVALERAEPGPWGRKGRTSEPTDQVQMLFVQVDIAHCAVRRRVCGLGRGGPFHIMRWKLCSLKAPSSVRSLLS